MPFLRLFVEATVSSVPQDRALAEEARSYCGSCTGPHALDLAAAAFVPFPPSSQSSGFTLLGTSPSPAHPSFCYYWSLYNGVALLIFQRAFTYIFSFDPYNNPVKQLEAGLLSPFGRWGKMKYNALKWQVLSDPTRSWSMAVAGPVLNHSHTPPGLELSKKQGVILIGAMSISTLSNIFCKHSSSSALDP